MKMLSVYKSVLMIIYLFHDLFQMIQTLSNF